MTSEDDVVEKVMEQEQECERKNPRTYIDVVRKGGKRRGYVTVRVGEDGCAEVGWSLCELRDRFNGALGVEIAFKRGIRTKDKLRACDYGRDIFVLNDEGETPSSVFKLPTSFVSRILRDVERMVEKSNGAGVVLPKWVVELQSQFAVEVEHEIPITNTLGGKGCAHE